jgi:hypothetical protein
MRSRAAAVATVLALAAGCQSDIPVSGVAQVGAFRLANLSPDLPAVDYCFRMATDGIFQGPQMKAVGVPGGIVYANPARQVSNYLILVTGSWVLRIVQANAADCTVPLVPDQTVVISADSFSTVAVVGVAGSTDAPHATYTWANDQSAPASQAMVRFVNAALSSATAAAPPLDGGTGAPGSFQKIFPAVPYPGPAIPSATVNGNGYAAVDPALLTPTSTFSACIAGAAPGPLTCPISQAVGGIGLPAGYTGTAFAVGGTPTAPARLLFCLDNSWPAASFFATCQ